MVRAADEPREFADPEDITTKIREYIRVIASLDSLETRRKDLRTDLFEYIDAEGEEDHKGNVFLEFDAPIDGVPRLEKQRRVSRKLDENIAEPLLEEKGLTDKVYKTIRVLDEDAIMAAHYEGELTEEEIDQMFPETVVWALRTPKK